MFAERVRDQVDLVTLREEIGARGRHRPPVGRGPLAAYEARGMTRTIARLIAALTLALAVTACGARRWLADETIDGYAIGPARSVSGDEFHRLEVTARDVVRSRWPG